MFPYYMVLVKLEFPKIPEKNLNVNFVTIIRHI